MYPLLLTLLSIFSALQSGINSGTISGFVSDHSNQSRLSEATISISKSSLSASTNANGEFQISVPAPGNYDILFKKKGYKPYTVKNLDINDKGKISVEIYLAPLKEISSLDSLNTKSLNASVDYGLRIAKPDPKIDYKILIVKPNPNIDYKCLIKKAGVEVKMPPGLK
jgi:hypothetical protein